MYADWAVRVSSSLSRNIMLVQARDKNLRSCLSVFCVANLGTRKVGVRISEGEAGCLDPGALGNAASRSSNLVYAPFVSSGLPFAAHAIAMSTMRSSSHASSIR
jgi:hypothetical protein